MYTVEDDKLIVTVVKIGHRKDTYRQLDHLCCGHSEFERKELNGST
ncbi:MAG TPA: hypothetical protein VJB88_13005 [Vicinamibacteria bacterium]|nr:hypothetical protein [Vicinamibacteria bacterium]